LIDGFPYESFDMILTGFPPWVDEFRGRGIRAEYLPHAFDDRMAHLAVPWQRRSNAVAFVGNLSPAHRERISFLDSLSRHVDIDFYGGGIEYLPSDSPLVARHHGPAWGRDLHSVYGTHTIVVEVSGDMPGRWSFSKRLFEATGMGACLVAEEAGNLANLFTPDVEVASYRGLDSCLDQLRSLSPDRSRARGIAIAGQRRTWRSHLYANRAADFAGLVGLRPPPVEAVPQPPQ
jgi:hypothetical protein